MANAEIVSIGSELLLGQIVDTNAAWMAQRLNQLGVNLFYKTVVGDNPDRMKEVIGRALDRSDVVITGGGLGPTQDDLTREIIAEVTGRKLVLDPELVDETLALRDIAPRSMSDADASISNPMNRTAARMFDDMRAEYRMMVSLDLAV